MWILSRPFSNSCTNFVLGVHWDQEIHTGIEWHVGYVSQLHYIFPTIMALCQEFEHCNQFYVKFSQVSHYTVIHYSFYSGLSKRKNTKLTEFSSFTWLSSWMISNTQANHYFPSHKHVTKPTIDSVGRSFVLRVNSLLPGSVWSWIVTDSNFIVWDGNKWVQFSRTWNCVRLVKALLKKMLFSFVIFHAAIAEANGWLSCRCPMARSHYLVIVRPL